MRSHLVTIILLILSFGGLSATAGCEYNPPTFAFDQNGNTSDDATFHMLAGRQQCRVDLYLDAAISLDGANVAIGAQTIELKRKDDNVKGTLKNGLFQPGTYSVLIVPKGAGQAHDSGGRLTIETHDPNRVQQEPACKD